MLHVILSYQLTAEMPKYYEQHLFELDFGANIRNIYIYRIGFWLEIGGCKSS